MVKPAVIGRGIIARCLSRRDTRRQSYQAAPGGCTMHLSSRSLWVPALALLAFAAISDPARADLLGGDGAQALSNLTGADPSTCQQLLTHLTGSDPSTLLDDLTPAQAEELLEVVAHLA